MVRTQYTPLTQCKQTKGSANSTSNHLCIKLHLKSIFALFYFFFYFFFSLQYFYFLFLTTQLAVLILSFATDQKTYKSSSGLKNSRQIFSYATVSYHIHKRYHRGFLSVYSNMLHVSILFRILISRSILILSVFNCFLRINMY